MGINSTIVSGDPRNRTTLMMRIHLHALGEDRIIGDKWPQISKLKLIKNMPFGPERKIFHRMWKKREKRRVRINFDKAKIMNPLGFYEVSGWVVNGIKYTSDRSELIDKLDGRVIKVVSKGLASTDPRYVGRIVYMVRHPGSVATSQEDIHRKFDRGEIKINSPKDYNFHSYMAARWILDNPQVPVLPVDSDRMISEPDYVLSQVAEFEGEPEIAKQGRLIDIRLVRSKPKDNTSKIWADAFLTHKMLLAGDWQGIADYYEKNQTATHGAVESWPCLRRGDYVNQKMCELCMHRPEAMKMFRRFAESKEIDWRKEPCTYECTRLPEEDLVDIEDSIAENHWLENGRVDRDPLVFGSYEVNDYKPKAESEEDCGCKGKKKKKKDCGCKDKEPAQSR